MAHTTCPSCGREINFYEKLQAGQNTVQKGVGYRSQWFGRSGIRAPAEGQCAVW